jgi:Na+/H+ antiporter NhaD/arsenite permease-like protein
MDWLVLGVFAAVYLGMFLGGVPGLALDRSGVALLGAIVLLASGRVSLDEAQAALDVPTLTLLLGLMVVSAQLRLGGFYTRTAQRLAEAALEPALLLALVMAAAAALSAVLANDVVCLAVTPVLALGCLRRGLSPLPFLLGLACASNIGSAATLIGNPQNMLIGQVLRLSFSGYLLTALGPALLSLAAAWGLLALLYRGRWRLDAGSAQPAAAEALRRAEDWPEFDLWQTAKGLVIVVLLVAAFLLTDWPRDIAALAAAGVLLCSRRMATRNVLGLVDWHLLVLFGGLFVVNHAFEAAGWLPHLLAGLRGLGVDPVQPAPLYVVTAGLSNLVSNVPAVMLLLPAVRQAAAPGSPALAHSGALLALSSTLAGNFLLVGSIANLIVAEQAKLQGVTLSWREHLRAGIPVTLATLGLTWLWLALLAH